ncbi:MAG: polyprenyl synthetase family protein [Ruminococcaceae bacterium]|nr:polyprenyl synthetase family protein [Oscillospiraceae bacterium]
MQNTKDYQNMIESALKNYLPQGEFTEQTLIDSMEYSLMCGGKRIRPLLTLLFCELCGVDAKCALPYACAVEMIHTYSLIHDDLPCMDDDDYRRGKLSNHKVYGEDIATLSGDAMQSLAFEIMLSEKALKNVSADKAVRAAHTLSKYCGVLGMVGGQVIDIENEGKNADINILQEMDEKKTAALIKAACEMGCIIGGASDEKIKAASDYAHSIGIAFQIVDDILDVTSTSEDLGKPVGSDNDNDKSTYVSLLGIDKCKELVDTLTNKAIESLSYFESDTTALKDLALSLKNRNN